MKLLQWVPIVLLLFLLHGRACAQALVAMPGPELVTGAGLLSIDRGEKQWLASADWRFAELKWNIRPWVGVAFAERGTWYTSAGLIYTQSLGAGWRLSVGSAPTYYQAGNGKFLGESFEFYSFAEVGHDFADGEAINLRFGHISNAHLSDYNPGTELLMLNWSVRFN